MILLVSLVVAYFLLSMILVLIGMKNSPVIEDPIDDLHPLERLAIQDLIFHIESGVPYE